MKDQKICQTSKSRDDVAREHRVWEDWKENEARIGRRSIFGIRKRTTDGMFALRQRRDWRWKGNDWQLDLWIRKRASPREMEAQ